MCREDVRAFVVASPKDVAVLLLTDSAFANREVMLPASCLRRRAARGASVFRWLHDFWSQPDITYLMRQCTSAYVLIHLP